MSKRLGLRAPAAIDCLEPRLLMAVQPVITEFLAQNTSNRTDSDGEFSDWIEIFNPDTSPRSLDGYSLTDDPSQLTQWQFPSGVTVSPGGYLLVWASGKDRRDPTQPLHTSFNLKAAGEYLGLIQPDGATPAFQYAPSFPLQSENVSYGVVGQNFTNPSFAYFNNPTPLALNGTQAVTVAAPTFSKQRGFYDNSFSLTLSAPTAGASIRYTTNGSAPSATNGKQYSGSFNVSTTTIVRAIAYKGSTTSAVVTQSYIFLNDVLKQPASVPGFPNKAEFTDETTSVLTDTAMDPNVVNDSAYKSMIKGAMKAIPTLSVTGDINDIFGTNGFYFTMDVERPVSIELIDPAHPEDNSGLNGGMQGHSHVRVKRSFKLSFKSDYGPTEWDSDILKNGPVNGGSASDHLDDLILRAGNNRSWARANVPATYTEDEFYRETQVAIDGTGSHGTFLHLYLNGVYWGLYNTVEQPNESMQERYFGGAKEDYFTTDSDGSKKGDATRWNYLTTTLVNKDLSVQSNYQELQRYLDVQQFADYLIASFYQGQTDWPSNNWYAGYHNGLNPTPARFYAWDGEKAWDRGNFSNPSGGALVNPAFLPGSNDPAVLPRLWRAALENSDFRTLFADRVYTLTTKGGPLSDAEALKRWDTLNKFIQDAIVGESARWGDIGESLGDPTRTRDDDFLPEVAKIRGIIQSNANRLISVLRDENYYPSVNPPKFAQHGGTIGTGGVVISNPNSKGKIYYTTDGSDPRLGGTNGALSPSAKVYSGAIQLQASSAQIRTRVLSGSTWSAEESATFSVQAFAGLRIVEMMYAPAAPGGSDTTDADEFEFLELQNTGATTLDLAGVKLDGGIDYTFENGSLAPGAYIVIAKNIDAFKSRYSGVTPAGEYSGKLANEGESLRLHDPSGVVLLDFKYSPDWYPETNGQGASLVIVDAHADAVAWNDSDNWRASAATNGTPSAPDAEDAPVNAAPVVEAHGPEAISLPQTAALSATVTDDGLPQEGAASTLWTMVSGPGAVSFGDDSAAETSASFSKPGQYVLRVTVNDSELSSFAELAITAAAIAAPPVSPVAAADVAARPIGQATTDIDVLANDTDPEGGLLTITNVSQPANGLAEVDDHGTPADPSDDTIVYSAAPGFNGDDTFTYTLQSGGGSATATVNVTTNAGAGLDSDPFDPSKTALFIVGTNAGETIKIAKSRALIRVMINKLQRAVLPAPTGSVVVIGKGGNDKITTGALKNNRAIFFGGEGNDTLKGTRFNDVLVGGPGNDNVSGAAGLDLLIGGDGIDKINGAAGDDVIVSGFTDYDAYTAGNSAALRDLIDTWANGQTYSQRVASLTSEGGVGSSAAHFLQNLLHDDGSVDKVNGSSGEDVYFVNPTAERIKKIASESIRSLP